MTQALLVLALAVAAAGGQAGVSVVEPTAVLVQQPGESPSRRAPEPPSPPVAAPHLVVSLVTMGPGRNIWDRFGHTAIWIADTAAGTGQAYNYGLFDFGQDNFLLRLLRGRMWYWMAPFPAERYIGSYIRDDRSVWVQELNLDAEQRAALQAFLQWNARDENRFYGYDYYRDNCSTRVRDALDRVLGGAIREATGGVPTGTTYRSHTRRLLAPAPLAYTGTHLALGSPTDVELSLWEAMFVPMEMQRAIRDVRIADGDGGTRPLVRAEYTLHESTTFTERRHPPEWWPVYLLIGIAIGGAFVLLARGTRRGQRRALAVLAALWCAAFGTVGLIMTALWALTEHVATYWNENLLQANLLILPLAFLVPRLAAGSSWAARPAQVLAAVIAALSVAGLLLQLLPGFDQANTEIIALLLPANIGLWLAVRTLVRASPRAQSGSVKPSAAAPTTSPGAASAA